MVHDMGEIIWLEDNIPMVNPEYKEILYEEQDKLNPPFHFVLFFHVRKSA